MKDSANKMVLFVKKSFALFIASMVFMIAGSLISSRFIFPVVRKQIRDDNYALWLVLLACGIVLMIAAYYFRKDKRFNGLILPAYAVINGAIITPVIGAPLIEVTHDAYFVTLSLMQIGLAFVVLTVYALFVKNKFSYPVMITILVGSIVLGFFVFFKCYVPRMVTSSSIPNGFDYSKNIPVRIKKNIFEKKVLKIVTGKNRAIVQERYALAGDRMAYQLRDIQKIDIPGVISEKDFSDIIQWQMDTGDPRKERIRKYFAFDPVTKMYHLAGQLDEASLNDVVGIFTYLSDRKAFFAFRTIDDHYLNLLLLPTMVAVIFLIIMMIDLRGILKKYSPDEHVACAIKLQVDLVAFNVGFGAVLLILIGGYLYEYFFEDDDD